MKGRTGRTPAERNVEEIAQLEYQEVRERPLPARISLAITDRVGTFTFAVVQTTILIAWCLWNSFAPERWQFDPYPYGLLTMIVSMEGVILAVFVLITQNRMSEQSDERAHLNLQVDLLAEQEMTMVLRMLKRITEKLGIEPDTEEERTAAQLMQETNIYELLEQMRKRFDAK
jgi:uncharacterized membrane protein